MSGSLILVASLINIGGCTSNADIESQPLNDRVKACSAGFSESTRMGLDASLNKAALKGDLTGDVKEETKSMIFDSIPNGDRLKAYEDYIACVEKHWNQ